MKTIISSTLALALTGSVAFAQDALPQQDNDWFTAAQAQLEAKAAVQPNTNKAKNVIILIADGNGVGTNYATRLFDGQQNGNYGDEHVLHHETFPHLALAKTYNVNAQTPDSAGTGTAMHSGVKTKAGVIGVDETLNRGDCSQVEGATVANAAEIYTAMGKAVGVISTARLTHATPASAYAHSADRNFEDNSKLPEGCQVPDIATQMIEAVKAGRVDVALGGGRRHFIPTDVTDEEGKGGKRTDGKNLIEEAKAAGVQYVFDDASFEAAKLDGTPLVGLFESSHMKYEADRTGEPSLAEMTEAAIKALQNNEQGFFLTVEAGRVDHANHDGNLARVVRDGVAFAEAVAKADELTNDEDTLIIVTADHEHAIAFQGYAGRGSDILGLSMKINPAGIEALDEPNTAADNKPYTTVGYLNGSGSILTEDQDWTGTRPALTQEEATDLDYVQQALIPMSSETHSGEDVAIYAKGPFAHLLNGTVEQNFVFHVMHHAATAE
ncbi:alkaline phosphatase [Roseibium sediminicola]|uniref:Alkaline phosphatase n=1 Tax=Roseibium sediminicola TaxID=2933272 RepID=A0ABT0GTQ7_9HYPH|nr:alkaline phosphatase [Roseibium sp. CAU 1639]MCK7612818.1 alkaline phosphatase [Roseibium sp. CAU 1639]